MTDAPEFLMNECSPTEYVASQNLNLRILFHSRYSSEFYVRSVIAHLSLV